MFALSKYGFAVHLPDKTLASAGSPHLYSFPTGVVVADLGSIPLQGLGSLGVVYLPTCFHQSLKKAV